MAKYRIVKKYNAEFGEYFSIQRKFLFIWIPASWSIYSSPEAAERFLKWRKEETTRLKGKSEVVKELEV
jgi:hypothetical protein